MLRRSFLKFLGAAAPTVIAVKTFPADLKLPPLPAPMPQAKLPNADADKEIYSHVNRYFSRNEKSLLLGIKIGGYYLEFADRPFFFAECAVAAICRRNDDFVLMIDGQDYINVPLHGAREVEIIKTNLPGDPYKFQIIRVDLSGKEFHSI